MATASPSRLQAAAAARHRVLIVDDNVELVGSLHAVLMSAELSDGRAASNTIDVVTASRGDEGLAIVLDAEQMAPEQVRHPECERLNSGFHGAG